MRPRKPAAKSKPTVPATLEIFAGVPLVIREKGRIEGFETLRDLLLQNPDLLTAAAMPLYSVFKLVLEVDRHALFASLAAEKATKSEDAVLVRRYMEWLQKGVSPVGAETASPETEEDRPDGAS